jgi:hypothetical protein
VLGLLTDAPQAEELLLAGGEDEAVPTRRATQIFVRKFRVHIRGDTSKVDGAKRCAGQIACRLQRSAVIVTI